jgi:hypothetical protein
LLLEASNITNAVEAQYLPVALVFGKHPAITVLQQR